MLSGHKMIVVVCEIGGYAVINRLQNSRAWCFHDLIMTVGWGTASSRLLTCRPRSVDGAIVYDVDNCWSGEALTSSKC